MVVSFFKATLNFDYLSTTRAQRLQSLQPPRTQAPVAHLFVTQVVHARGYVHSKLEQLLGGERGGRAVLLGERRVCLQHSALPQEVQKVSVWSVFNGDVQVACKTRRLLSICIHPLWTT